MLEDDEDVVIVGDGPEPVYESLKDVRVMPDGRRYWVPDPGKRVISLEEDCGLLLEDVEFLRHMPAMARFYPNGDPFRNAQWKKKNLLKFRRPWRPTFRLPR